MKYRIILFLTLMAAVLTGRAAEHSLNVGQFNRLKIDDNINVVYRCDPDSTGLAIFHADDARAKAFIFSNSGGQLKVQVNTDDIDISGETTVYVYSDYLTAVENGGNLTVRVESPHPCPEFKATQVGNGTVIVEDITATEVKGKLATGLGNVILSGRCTKADFTMVGTGSIQADRLEADEVQCKILGSGSIGCWAQHLLKVKGIGSTKIYYKGSPEIKKAGGGKLLPLARDRVSDYFIPEE